MKYRKIQFIPIDLSEEVKDDKEITEVDIWQDGYFEYWGQGTSLIWHKLSNFNEPIPVIQNFILGIVRDKKGNVYTCFPNKIRFMDD